MLCRKIVLRQFSEWGEEPVIPFFLFIWIEALTYDLFGGKLLRLFNFLCQSSPNTRKMANVMTNEVLFY